MTRIVVVPDSVREAIDKALDAAYAACPAAAVDRDYNYRVLLAYFDEHGEVPTFSIEPNRWTD